MLGLEFRLSACVCSLRRLRKFRGSAALEGFLELRGLGLSLGGRGCARLVFC